MTSRLFIAFLIVSLALQTFGVAALWLVPSPEPRRGWPCECGCCTPGQRPLPCDCHGEPP